MGKNITIDGITYNNIESVSVNGNIFGGGSSSDYTEEVIRRNYSPNGQAFVDTVPINFANGDYIEAQVDLTNQPAGRIIFGAGKDISIWPGKTANDDVIYAYHNQNNEGIYSLSYMHSVQDTSGHIRATNRTIPSPATNKCNIKISAAGLWIDDALIKPSSFEESPEDGHAIYIVRSAFLDMTAIQIGAAQSNNDYSYAYYNYIKVFRKVS